jgi:predicted RNA methylase
VKNVKGEEIFSTKEEKLKFYDTTYSRHNIISNEEFFVLKTPVKDDYFNEILIPFCAENSIQSVLDVGAADGRQSARFVDAGIKRVVATEISPGRTTLLEDTLKKYGYTTVEVKCADIEDDKIENFDLIFLSDLVEHLVDCWSTWKKCIKHSRFVYALIPREDSWDWSPDHVNRFDIKYIDELIDCSNGLVTCNVLNYDENNSWYSFIVKGNL